MECWPDRTCMLTDQNYFTLLSVLYIYRAIKQFKGNKKLEFPARQHGKLCTRPASAFTVNGQVVNILDFVGHMFLFQLFNSVLQV